MRARQFFYICAGILLLVAAYSIGSYDARADFDETQGPIIGLSAANYVIRSDGTFWGAAPTSPPEQQWYPVNGPEGQVRLRVPVSQVAFIDAYQLITKDGHAWYHTGEGTGWVRTNNPIPAPVGVQGQSWSGVKSGYKK